MKIEGDYQRDGAVCVRGAFSPDEIELARAAIDANVASLSPLAQRASKESDGAFIEDFCSWQRIAEMRSQFDETVADLTSREIFDERIAANMPLGRPQTPEDIGNAVAFLASDDALYITGSRIFVDGGMDAQLRTPSVDFKYDFGSSD